jgi:hypothetical protein
MPRSWAVFTPSSKLRPASIVSIITFVVELKAPLNARSLAAGKHSRNSEKTGALSITVDSKKKPFPLARASSLNSS